MPAPNATRHDSFTLARHLDAPPAAVFAAFADTELWRKWFRMPGSAASYEHDFQVGGLDLAQSAFTHPDGRVDDVPRWASLVTVELHPDGNGTGRGACATQTGTQMTSPRC